jgi:hypothetical protein
MHCTPQLERSEPGKRVRELGTVVGTGRARADPSILVGLRATPFVLAAKTTDQKIFVEFASVGIWLRICVIKISSLNLVVSMNRMALPNDPSGIQRLGERSNVGLP